MAEKTRRINRWYFGGLASAGAACCTHPLELLKVHLQTQQEGKMSLIKVTRQIIKTQGVLAMYSGLSASLCRQFTYSTTRFAVYEAEKQTVSPNGEPISFPMKIAMAASAGASAGVVGTPADMVNVRMQNDVKLPPDKRRNYKNAFDGFWRIYKEEGFRKLFSGVSIFVGRSIFMNIGQLSFYDQVKQFLLTTRCFEDNPTTHFLSSFTAGVAATTLAHPLDVLKTRAMNAKPGEYKNLWHIVRHTAELGILGFYKGYVTAFVRLVPHTILIFLILEQLRQNFGIIKEC